jgi:hypothetical protein
MLPLQAKRKDKTKSYAKKKNKQMLPLQAKSYAKKQKTKTNNWRSLLLGSTCYAGEVGKG